MNTLSERDKLAILFSSYARVPDTSRWTFDDDVFVKYYVAKATQFSRSRHIRDSWLNG